MTKEKPTARKLRKAREKGEVAKSTELVFALLFTGAVVMLWGFKGLFGSGLKQVYTSIFTEFSLRPILVPWLLILLGLSLIAFAGHYLQVGWVWSVKAVAWKWRKRKGGFRPLFFLLKTAAVMTLGYLVVKMTRPTQELIFGSSQKQVGILFSSLLSYGLALSILLLVIGLLDFFYQKWRYLKQQGMSRAELKEEQRELEGDPELKERLKQRD